LTSKRLGRRNRTRRPHRYISRTKIEWFQDRVRVWFAANRRDFPWRRSSDAYTVTIAELLLQQTAAPRVAEFIDGFLRDYPNWESLVRADCSTLEEALKPLGLYKKRSATLKRLADALVASDELPRTRAELEVLPGIGQYIASAVLLAIHGRPEPLLDGNMARVLERFFGPRLLADIRHDPYLQRLAREVVRSADCLDLNWAILDFAAAVCRPSNPHCGNCPMASRCRYVRLSGRGAAS